MNIENLHHAHKLSKEIDELALTIKHHMQQKHFFRVFYADRQLGNELARIAADAVIAAEVERLGNKVHQLIYLGLDLTPLPPHPHEEDDDE